MGLVMNKMAKNKFYAVFGSNAVGVFNNWERAEESLRWADKGTTKGSKSYLDIVEAAIEGYKDRSGQSYKGPFPMNFLLRKENIKFLSEHFNPDDKIKVEYKNGKPVFVKKDET